MTISVTKVVAFAVVTDDAEVVPDPPPAPDINVGANAPHSPEYVALIGDWVTATRLGVLIELSNWVASNRPTVHINQCFGEKGWGDGGASAEAGVVSFEYDKLARKIRARIYVSADYPTIRVGIQTIAGVGRTGELSAQLGADTHTFTCTSAQNDLEQIFDFESVPAGWLSFFVNTEWLTDGSPGATAPQLLRLRVQDVSPDTYAMPEDYIPE